MLKHALVPHALFSSFALFAALAASAQETQQITVTGRIIASPLQVGGFGDIPLARTPIAASLITAGQLADAGARSISDLTRLDAAISDAYNAEGYYQSLTVRGFVIDNRFNYRRDGLPVNAETALPLADKERIELLKGTSGIQAGTSAPGGLVNLVVKRPTRNVESAGLSWREKGSVGVQADLSRRFGSDEAFGLRVNAAYDHIDPQVRDARGHARLFSAAGDWRLSPDTLVEAEVETNRQSQPSVPGFSLLRDRLPGAGEIDPRINLNNQPWSLPVVFEGRTGSVRLQQRLDEDWRFTAHAMTQRLTTQDRVAFPYGKYDANFNCDPCDRFDSDGSFTYWDFRSENEHRRSDALDLQVAGQIRTGGIRHEASAGVLFTRFEGRAQRQAFNLIPSPLGNVDGSAVVPPDPSLTGEGTDRDERSTELYLRDAMRLSAQWSLWAGLRHSRLVRESVLTDGSEATQYRQSFTTPWLALGWQLAPRTLLYTSWGEGVESQVVPNQPAAYANAGQVLPAMKSRQLELGLKHAGESVSASAAVFSIDRPATGEVGGRLALDGSARHRGVEWLLSWQGGPWQLHAAGMWLDAKRRGSQDAALNGLRPTNVADRTLRLGAEHRLGALPGAALLASLVYEGDRMVLPDNSVRIPGWARLDLGARWTHRAGPATLTWRLGVDNATDKRAWKEAPYQYEHAYLFPMAPRTWRASVQADL